MTLPLINFQGTLVATGNKPATFLNTEALTWYNIAVFTEANVSPTNTGWETIQVDAYGVLRADVESNVPDPVPAITNTSVLHTVTLFIYPDESLVAVKGAADAKEGAPGFIGMVELAYDVSTFSDGSKNINDAYVTDVVGVV